MEHKIFGRFMWWWLWCLIKILIINLSLDLKVLKLQLIILGELIDYSSGEKSKFAIGQVAQGAHHFDILKPKAWPKVCEILKR